MQRLSNALHDALGSYLRDALTRAVLILWHAFLFLGLRLFPLFFFLRGGHGCFFLQDFSPNFRSTTVLMLWHAFLFLGLCLWVFPSLLVLAWWFPLPFLVNKALSFSSNPILALLLQSSTQGQINISSFPDGGKVHLIRTGLKDRWQRNKNKITLFLRTADGSDLTRGPKLRIPPYLNCGDYYILSDDNIACRTDG
jgi:hypothetical protein